MALRKLRCLNPHDTLEARKAVNLKELVIEQHRCSCMRASELVPILNLVICSLSSSAAFACMSLTTYSLQMRGKENRASA
jgi:hypothetical protein